MIYSHSAWTACIPVQKSWRLLEFLQLSGLPPIAFSNAGQIVIQINLYQRGTRSMLRLCFIPCMTTTFVKTSRDDRIWTCNHSLPKRPFYQIELHPVVVIEQRINYDDFYTVFCVIVRNYISVFEQFLQHIFVGLGGLGPPTHALKVRYSTNWVTNPFGFYKLFLLVFKLVVYRATQFQGIPLPRIGGS